MGGESFHSKRPAVLERAVDGGTQRVGLDAVGADQRKHERMSVISSFKFWCTSSCQRARSAANVWTNSVTGGDDGDTRDAQHFKHQQ